MPKLSTLASILIGVALITPTAPPIHAATETSVARLVEQAYFWQKKGRDDLAGSVWKKLLQVEPNHPDAWIELGNIEIRAGRLAEADAILKRAASLQPPPSRLSELESAIRFSRVNPQELSTARKEAASGNSEQALTRYKSILGENSKPEGLIGLEYYQTLAGTREGWDAARKGLESLAQKNPEDDRYLLALARHLTYREPTRSEGIRVLSGLAGSRSSIATEARDAWRQALVWLGNSQNDRAQYQAYLKHYPADEAIQSRIAQTQNSPQGKIYKPSKEQIARQSGFHFLNAGDIEQAEIKFSSILKANPEDTDALGGLGLIRLRQEKFNEASNLLSQAIRTGRNKSSWIAAKKSADYWLTLQPVLAAKSSGSLIEQEANIHNALEIDRKEPTAQVLLADLLKEKGNLSEATRIYKKILSTDPNNSLALEGYSGLLLDSGRNDEARRLINRLDASSNNNYDQVNSVKVNQLIRIAESEERAGNVNNALRSLEDALLIEPSSPSARLGLYRLYQRAGQRGAAMAISDDLLIRQNDSVDVQRARASLLSEQGRWRDALLALEQIPTSKRTPDLVRDQRRYWINAQVERAKQFYLAGQSRESQAVLMHTEKAAGTDFDALSAVAKGWSDTAQQAQAYKIARQLGRNIRQSSVSNRLQFAGLLFNLGQDRELLQLLQEVSDSPQLSLQDESTLNNLIIAYTAKQADSLREAGKTSEAFNVLTPALNRSNDIRLRLALARLYDSNRESSKASAIAEEIVREEPNELEHRLLAASLANNSRNYDLAQQHIRAAFEIAPDHPRVYTVAGQIEKSRGNLNKAMEYFRYAQAMETNQQAFSGSKGALSLRLLDKSDQTQGYDQIPGSQQPVQPIISNNRILPIPLSPVSGQMLGKLPFNEITNLPAPYTSRPNFPVEERNDNSRNSTQKSFFERLLSPLLGNASPTDLPSDENSYKLYPANYQSENLIGNYPEIRNDGYRISRNLNANPTNIAYNSISPEPLHLKQAKPSRSINDEIQDISLNASRTITFGGGFRNKSGEEGFSRITEYSGAIEANLPIDFESKLTLRLTPVILDAGTLALSNSSTATRYGSAGLGSFLVPGTFTDRSQIDKGVALSVGLETGKIAVDVGITPTAFPVNHVVGGLTLSDKINDLSLKGNISRRPVTDSILSYAGSDDPRTGQTWGGVVKSGGRIDLSLGDSNAGVYAGLGFSQIGGKQVKSNNAVEGGFGTYWKAYQSVDTAITLGLNFTAMSYQYNLSQFTLGHGGYFSPQRFISLGVPFEIAGRQGSLAYLFAGDIGLRSIHQDEALYYPNDPALQAAWVTQAATLGSGYKTSYVADNSTGVGYRLLGAMEYKVAKDISVGGRLSFDNSNNYKQQQGLIYIRHAFDGLPSFINFPPKPLRLFAEGGSL